MAYDMGIDFFGIDPGVPHHLMGKESVFGDTHRIYHSAQAIVFRTSSMGLRVGEDDFCSPELTLLPVPGRSLRKSYQRRTNSTVSISWFWL